MCLFCFKQKTAYEMRISDGSSDVCSSDLRHRLAVAPAQRQVAIEVRQRIARLAGGDHEARAVEVLEVVDGPEAGAMDILEERVRIAAQARRCPVPGVVAALHFDAVGEQVAQPRQAAKPPVVAAAGLGLAPGPGSSEGR